MPADLSIGINKQRSTNGKGVEMSLDTARTSAYANDGDNVSSLRLRGCELRR